MSPPNDRQEESAVWYGIEAAERPAGAVVIDRPDPLWESVTGEITAYVRDMTSANAAFRAVTRTAWLDALADLWSRVGEPGQLTHPELRAVQDAVRDLRSAFGSLQEEAVDLLGHLIDEYTLEKEDLEQSDQVEDELALACLESAWTDAQKRIDAVGQFIVLEDLLPFHQILDSSAHIIEGEKRAAAFWKESQRLKEEFEEEPQLKVPGVGVIAWEIVGWESWGDFGSDVALTVVTAGGAKLFKVAVKVRKVRKKLEKLTKLKRMRALRKVRRQQRLAAGAAYMATNALTKVLTQMGPQMAEWIKKNGARTFSAYVTDELAVTLSEGEPFDKNVLERVSIDAVREFVSAAFDLSTDNERAQFRVALLAYSGRGYKIGHAALRVYLRHNFSRRFLANFIYTAIRTGTFQRELSASALGDVALSTAGEMAQDLLGQFASHGFSLFVIDFGRKTLHGAITAWLK